MMLVIFENNKWVLGWTNQSKTRLRIQSKDGKGYATAYLAQKQLQYEILGLSAYHEPRVAYINEDIVPAYMKSKCTAALSRGARWR